MDEEPYADVQMTPDGLSLPELKWRELVFTGAMREEQGEWRRDPTRPLPRFDPPDLFAVGARFRIAERGSGRVRLERL